jgi:EAL domain-containing protein (putative c-di-GMP-specific phosphodiesterase class I)/GGDEF domain-containing protein
MTLFKQISVLVVCGFVLLYALISADNLKQSGSLLGNQLQSAAQDTATVLGVSITTTQAMSDVAQLETLLNTVFDSGYYSHISLARQSGEIVFEKHRDLNADGVPSWFVNLVDIYPATASANIMQGWTPAGELKITLHPGFAYRDLYQRLVSTLIWFSSIFIVILCLLWVLLHSLLKPLSAIERQANSAEENRFERLDVRSRTLEFTKIISALNRLTANAQRVYFDQQSTLKELNKVRFQDPLTGLKNRRYMMGELDRMAAEDTAFVGCLFLLKLEDVAELRARQAYEEADSRVLNFVSILQAVFEEDTEFAAGRISEDEFLVLVGQPWSDIQIKVDQLIEQTLQSESCSDIEVSACELGVGEKAGELLAKLDLALAQVESRSSSRCQFISSQDRTLPSGKGEWRSWFEAQLEAQGFFLVAQSVYDRQEKVVHRELFIRAYHDNLGEISASTFMPMANSLELTGEVDRSVFAMLMRVPELRRQTKMAVNLSSSSIISADTAQHIDALLDAYKTSPGCLCFEIAHSLWLKHPKECRQLTDKVHAAGQSLGVDHFSLDWSVDFLRELKPEYIKLNANILDELSSDNSAGGYRALRNLTLSLNIQLIAVGIDDQALLARLQALSLDGMQGNLLGQPGKLT